MQSHLHARICNRVMWIRAAAGGAYPRLKIVQIKGELPKYVMEYMKEFEPVTYPLQILLATKTSPEDLVMMVVHSHIRFGCWLATKHPEALSFEELKETIEDSAEEHAKSCYA